MDDALNIYNDKVCFLKTLKDVRTWLEANKKSEFFGFRTDFCDGIKKKTEQDEVLQLLSEFDNICGLYNNFCCVNLDKNMLLKISDILKEQHCLRILELNFSKLKFYFIFTFIGNNKSYELNHLTDSIFKTVPKEI